MITLFSLLVSSLIHAKLPVRQLTSYYTPVNVNNPQTPASQDNKKATSLYFIGLGQNQELYLSDFEANEKSFQPVKTASVVQVQENGVNVKKSALLFKTIPLPPKDGGWGMRFVIKQTEADGRIVVKDLGVVFEPGKTYNLEQKSFRFRRANLSME